MPIEINIECGVSYFKFPVGIAREVLKKESQGRTGRRDVFLSTQHEPKKSPDEGELGRGQDENCTKLSRVGIKLSSLEDFPLHPAFRIFQGQ